MTSRPTIGTAPIAWHPSVKNPISPQPQKTRNHRLQPADNPVRMHEGGERGRDGTLPSIYVPTLSATALRRRSQTR